MGCELVIACALDVALDTAEYQYEERTKVPKEMLAEAVETTALASQLSKLDPKLGAWAFQRITQDGSSKEELIAILRKAVELAHSAG